MTAVVLTVKESYIASTKYRGPNRADRSQIVRWQMRAPAKKPLVPLPDDDASDDGDSWKRPSGRSEEHRSGEARHHSDALMELSQFKHPPQLVDPEDVLFE